MQNVSLLPHDVLSIIFTLSEAQPKDLATVSKDWNSAVQNSLAVLFYNYQLCSPLKSYVDRANQIQLIVHEGSNQTQFLNLQKVKFIFQMVVQKAHKNGFTMEINMGSVSIEHLQNVAAKIEKIKVDALMKLVKNLFFSARIPIINGFLKTTKGLPLLDIAEKVRTWMQEHTKELANISKLHLSDRGFTVLPKEIKYLTGFIRLDLGKNRLTSLPKEIGSLTRLKSLILINNQLTHLPHEVSFLTRLRILNLKNNHFSSLPSGVRFLTRLLNFDLSYNLLRSIPKEIESLTKLKKLNLYMNQFNDFPENTSTLTYKGDGVYIKV